MKSKIEVSKLLNIVVVFSITFLSFSSFCYSQENATVVKFEGLKLWELETSYSF
jgi:hypothetical protein